MSKIHLLVEYYTIDVPDRQAELDYCLIHNIQNKNIDFVHIFGQINVDESMSDSKVIVNYRDNRTTYRDYFEYSMTIPDGDLIIISNSDIYFDDTLNLLHLHLTPDNAFALTRWDDLKNQGHRMVDCKFVPHFNSQASHDVWALKTPVKNISDMHVDFNLGTYACDNVVAYQLSNYGEYLVSNPSYDIRCYHMHKSGYRTYSSTEPVPGIRMDVPLTYLYNMGE